jgi:tetratricopeptide (TPR) repeat protein
MFGR